MLEHILDTADLPITLFLARIDAGNGRILHSHFQQLRNAKQAEGDRNDLYAVEQIVGVQRKPLCPATSAMLQVLFEKRIIFRNSWET